ADRPATVIKNLAAQAVDAIGHLLDIRSNELAEHRPRDQRAGLAAQVADQKVEVDPATGGFGRSTVVFAVEVRELPAEEMDPVGPLDHVEEHAFPTAYQSGSLPDVGKSILQGVRLIVAARVGEPAV